MSTQDYQQDLPCPTNRDSTASAIFNLYGYSARDSSHGLGKAGTAREGNEVRSAGGVPIEEDEYGLTEELRSPEMQDSGAARWHSPIRSSGHARDRSSIRLTHGESAMVGFTNEIDRDTALDSTSSDREVHDRLNEQLISTSASRPLNATGQEDHPATAHARHSRRSSALSAVSANILPNPNPLPNSLQNGVQSRQSNGDSSAHLAPRPDSRHHETDEVDSIAMRHPGEEEDAYHVRSTYARLEVQGVYGDGWDEGVERTRGRAIMNERRGSQRASMKNDTLPEQERKALAKVDRYGFFDQALKTRQENRVYRIPARAFRKTPKVLQTPPKRAKVDNGGHHDMMAGGTEDTTGAVPQSITPDEIERLDASRRETFRRKEAERVGKWERMLLVAERDSGGNVISWKWDNAGKGLKLPERVYKGVPDRWRSAAWSALIDARSRQRGSQGFKQPGITVLSETYRRALDIPSSFDVQIDLDVPRTISGHILFHTRYGHGQRSLFHVLHCFSTYCSECGYCQGMGPIAATLLCYFDPARVYTLLVRLHDVYNMHGIFIHGFPGLLENFYVQERLIEHTMPDVYAAFEKNMISASSYATKWYITLFANTVPFQTQLRIWDALLLEGQDILVMTSLAIIFAYRSVLTAPNATFETILSTLSAFYIPEDEDLLMQWIHKMMKKPETRSMMDGWRKKWQELVRTKEDGRALL